jgi:hypothetical protein
MVFAGTASIAQAGRMIFQGVFVPGSVYAPNLFDVFFDWTMLALLGAIPLAYGLHGYYRARKRQEHGSWVWVSDNEMMPESDFEELQERAFRSEHRGWFSKKPAVKRHLGNRH